MGSEIWKHCLFELQDELPQQQFNTWIRPLSVSEETNELRISAPNRFVMNWIRDKYLDRIHEIVNKVSNQTIDIIVDQRNETAFSSQAFSGFLDKKVNESRKPSTLQSSAKSNQSEILLDDYSKQDASVIISANNQAVNQVVSPELKMPQEYHREQIAEDLLAEVGDERSFETYLKPQYKFDTFVKGDSNQFALAAATSVAENPGVGHNPLFIYGSTGLGKTHLMHAVGHSILKKNPKARVMYLPSETFVKDMVSAFQRNAIEDFKRFYRSMDALLIDDIQFFAKKDRSQEEFFHTFNALLEGDQQVVITSDRFHKEIDGLEDRLKSRFGWGLTVQVDPPDLETRTAIIMRKAEEMQIRLNYECAFFIAELVRSNVRELEGALNRVKAHARFKGKAISIDLIKISLKDLLDLQKKQNSVDNIQKMVAEYYKIKVSDLSSKRRSRSIARPRQVAMTLSKELTNHSLPEIGEAFGGRDHTTVLHACKKIKELRDSDRDIAEDYNNLLRTLTT